MHHKSSGPPVDTDQLQELANIPTTKLILSAGLQQIPERLGALVTELDH